MSDLLPQQPSVSLQPETPSDFGLAQALSRQLNLPLETQTPVRLMVSQQGCWLRRVAAPELNWQIDFASPAYQQLFVQRTRHNDPLSRAIGCHKKTDLRVLDMTAGLGKDALWLSHCGAQVTLIERHPALAFLLQQAIDAIDLPMKVICMDAQDYLSTCTDDKFDVAYYDPMFETRTKSALVKKDMQILQALHGDDAPCPALIPLAKKMIPKVVVKRAKTDPVLCEGVHHQLITKVTRFDVY
jgi:16S rRNA (guanine1516-N2)-methyltransferase